MRVLVHLATRAVAAATVATVVGLVLGVAPAAADPPRPTDYSSVVTGLSPAGTAAGVVEADIVGGDSLLRLRVTPGHVVVVTGYGEEPYLRFGADGTVDANRNSPATYANADRYGDDDDAPDVDPSAAPVWDTVGDGGTYSWHDHRIHWMSSQPPAGVARGEDIRDWSVAIVVDDQPVTVEGVLRYERTVAWWPWALVVAALAGGVYLLGRRVPAGVVIRVAGGVACVVAMVVAVAEQLSIPEEAGRSAVRLLVPGVGLACAVLAVVAVLVRRRSVADVAAIGAVSAATGWTLRRLGVLTKPILPTTLDPSLDRAGTAAALGLALGAAALIFADRQSPQNPNPTDATPAPSPTPTDATPAPGPTPTDATPAP